MRPNTWHIELLFAVTVFVSFACAHPVFSSDASSEATTAEAWAQPTSGNHRKGYNGAKWRDEPTPSEWEFLGRTAQELHKKYDEMSSCEPEESRYWFHGCGGIDGGGFIEVRYGANGKVEEAWYTACGCTYTVPGKHFTDKTEALKYAVARATKSIQEQIDEKSAFPDGLRSLLKKRGRAYKELGNNDLSAQDFKLIHLLAPAAAKYESISSLSPTIYVRLDKLAKEFERNGFQMKKLSARKYKFFKPGGSSFVVTSGKNDIVQAEEAEWFLHDEINKDAIKVVRRAMR